MPTVRRVPQRMRKMPRKRQTRKAKVDQRRRKVKIRLMGKQKK